MTSERGDQLLSDTATDRPFGTFIGVFFGLAFIGVLVLVGWVIYLAAGAF